MNTYLYNPAADGYASKAWECLRRNLAFRTEIDAFRQALRAQQHPKIGALAKQDRNLIPAQAFLAVSSQLAKKGSLLRTGYGELPPKIEDTAWPELPELLRHCLESAANVDFEPLRQLDPMPVDAIGQPLLYGNPEQQDAFLRWTKTIPTNSEAYTIVAIPRRVRDTQRRQMCKKALLELLPTASQRAKKLKPTGRALGSRTEWAAYLFVEAELGAGKSKLSAWTSAAIQFYGGRLRQIPHGIKAHAREMRRVATQRMPLIEMHVKAIEEAIRKSYP